MRSVPRALCGTPSNSDGGALKPGRSKKSRVLELGKDSILQDYRTAYVSRQASLLGRKEVFTGKAKFGIFGDGKEVAQLAMARAFRKGDVRSGYYRDQTFMLPKGSLRLECGDHILFTARAGTRRRMEWGLNNTKVLEYLVTGNELPDGTVWRWLARNR